uniref:Protein-tyrosine-phosphatase n=1 Tax=Roseihalotalea indica TaxID=2867963 RepID=A0AA49JIE0_9BACT|nr:protein-tyrosine-phosphatase [Tunicatimonas sp. TK19036]
MHTIQEATQQFDQIPDERKESLRELAQFIQTKVSAGQEAQLIFICIHNSRRSHMSQLWASVAAHHYQIPRVQTYSGGTEATAFNPRAVAAMERAGLAIEKVSEGENPRYRVKYAEGAPELEVFSKKYDDPANPQRDFAAIMTCSQADEACPFVPGAAFRLALPYEDPKEADDTPEETSRYDERSQQIATEIFYCFSQIQLVSPTE